MTGSRDKRPRVRAERVDTKCGCIGHMTVDEIKARSVGESVNVTCPECGKIHLTIEEAEQAEAEKIKLSKRFEKIKSEAEV
jgi:Zn finger protein HypA/HybF involved in hydrogenase expression